MTFLIVVQGRSTRMGYPLCERVANSKVASGAHTAPTAANEVSLFKFKDAEVRVVKIDGEPWFCGADVLHVLYGKANGIAHVYGSLDAEQVSKVKRVHLGMRPGKDATVITESGLYKLVMRSDKPEAKDFQKPLPGSKDHLHPCNGCTREINYLIFMSFSR